jgi:hypothetical protein
VKQLASDLAAGRAYTAKTGRAVCTSGDRNPDVAAYGTFGQAITIRH